MGKIRKRRAGVPFCQAARRGAGQQQWICNLFPLDFPHQMTYDNVSYGKLYPLTHSTRLTQPGGAPAIRVLPSRPTTARARTGHAGRGNRTYVSVTRFEG
jgi:hypothetical protein